jgi:hypothetical protein
MEKVRTIWMNDRKWHLYNYIFYFHDQAGNFEQCASNEVLSYFKRTEPRLNLSLDECEGYLKFAYRTVLCWEAIREARHRSIRRSRLLENSHP